MTKDVQHRARMEARIEWQVERAVDDVLDARLMNGAITQAAYDAQMREIDREATAAYDAIREG